MGSACVLPVLVLVIGFATTAAASTPSSFSAASSRLVGIVVFGMITTIAFGLWWLALELMHQGVVRSENAERDEILANLRSERDRRVRACQNVRHEIEEAENEWRRTAAWYQQSFDSLKQSLEALKNDYLSLKPQYEQEYRELERNKEAVQLAQFLQTKFISDDDIPGIGPTREAVLRSNGIETAYDIEEERILDINGFGPALTRNLVAWKQYVSRGFRFNAAAAVSPNDLAPLVVKYRQFQQRIETKMQTSLAELRACSAKAVRHLPQFYARIPGLVAQLAQAKVDAQVLSADGS